MGPESHSNDWSGVGIGLRTPLWRQLAARDDTPVDWLEFIPENYWAHGGWRARELDAARERYPLIAHGVSLSVAGPDPIAMDHLERLKRVLDHVGSPVYSDHLCWSSAGGRQYFDLLPVPLTEEVAAYAAKRARRVSEVLERPLLLENVTTYAHVPGSTMSHGAFVRAVLEEADAYLLLDVNNTYLNAVNHGLSPLAVLESLPLERTRQIHLAGFEHDRERLLLDHHGAPVAAEVWELFRQAIARIGDVPVLIERDNNIPPLDDVLEEVDHARGDVAATVARTTAKSA